MEVLRFKENVLICVITAIKVCHLLLTLLQVITILAYVSTHLLFCIYLLTSNKKKTTVAPNISCCKIKPIALFDRTKTLNSISQDKSLLFFHNILILCANLNTCFAMGMTPNCSARYELTFSISFYLLNY